MTPLVSQLWPQFMADPAFAACFGSLGVLAGMYVCRHKTRKPLFTITVPLLLLAQCAALYFLLR